MFVVVGGGDQAVGVVGNGIVKMGVILFIIGLFGVVFVYFDEFKIDL